VAEVAAALAELPGKGYEKVLDRDGVVLFRSANVRLQKNS
jgi:hypothetical protein